MNICASGCIKYEFDDKDMAKVTTYGRNDDMELIVIHTKDLKALIDELYRRAALC